VQQPRQCLPRAERTDEAITVYEQTLTARERILAPTSPIPCHRATTPTQDAGRTDEERKLDL